MGKVILQEFVSLDGLVSEPNGSVDFIPRSTAGDQSFGRRQLAFMDTIGMILLGRTTYEMFAQYWPKVTSGEEDKPFADKINATPKVVFSRTLDGAPWGEWGNATIARDGKEVAKLRKESRKDMVIWGSISLARSLMEEGLIDQCELIVCPLVLGSGTSLFLDRGGPLALRLLGAQSFDRGMVLMAYSVSRPQT